MNSLSFTVPGPAQGKGRPRATAINGHARLFTDSKTRNYESLVALAAETAMQGAQPFDCALELHMRVRIVPAASASRKARSAMIAGDVAPTKKPDTDNVLKAVLDGCNAVAFRDDVLVVSLTATKVYADTAGVDVLIRPFVARAS